MSVADDISSREQRLRLEAELQSLYTALANYREREGSYIEASASIPKLLINQINETRHRIVRIEAELTTLSVEAAESQANELYQQAFEAELAGEYSQAVKLYRSAGRYGHPDVGAAMRSVRYLERTAKSLTTAEASMPTSSNRAGIRILISLALILIIILLVALFLNGGRQNDVDEDVALAPSTATVTARPTATAISQVIILDTATSFPANTPTPIPALPTSTATPLLIAPTLTVTSSKTPTPTLRAAPRIIEPKDGLVWGDGTIVFEFEDLSLADDELYCLNRMKGYDITLTENWSHEPRGNNLPVIPVEPNVFRVAKAQGMRCIVWSAAIGKTTCANIISENTEERVIGLPRPCDFD